VIPFSRSPERAVSRRWVVTFAFAATALFVALALGSVLAASATFGLGKSEEGQGAYVGETGLTYWQWRANAVDTIPTPVPGAVSHVVTAPTVLAGASTSYMINTGKVGNTSVRWEFRETAAAPLSREIELRFTDGLTAIAVKITAYIETRATGIFGPILFYFYWDAGTFAPGSVTVESMQVVALVCSAVGVCP
jgi:hypothetical protein